MMTKRSNHMPTLTRSDTVKSTGTLVRAAFHQKSCGARTLQTTIASKHHAYGPVARPMKW